MDNKDDDALKEAHKEEHEGKSPLHSTGADDSLNTANNYHFTSSLAQI